MFHKCKVTVVKRYFNKEMVDTYVKNKTNMAMCEKVSEGQEFIVDNPFEMPKDICASAWADIRPNIIAMASGSAFGFMKDENTIITTCTDPFRPVIFKIEKIS